MRGDGNTCKKLRMSKNMIHDKSFSFAVNIVRKCRELADLRKEYVLSKQLMRSATSVGAMIRESKFAESRKDFVHKLSIAQKEVHETIYWLDLLAATELLDKNDHVRFTQEAIEIRKIITAIIITTKNNTPIKYPPHSS